MVVQPSCCTFPRFVAHLPWFPGGATVHFHSALGGVVFANSWLLVGALLPWGIPCLRQNRQPLDVRAFKMSLMPKRLDGPEHWCGFQFAFR